MSDVNASLRVVLGPDAATNQRVFKFSTAHEAYTARRFAEMFGIRVVALESCTVADWGGDGRVEEWTLTLGNAA